MSQLKIIFLILISSICVHGQSDRKMTFPNIYFKINSTDYAKMPYTVDSCLKNLAQGVKNRGTPFISIWRDTVETEQLSKRRIKKFKYDLNKYMNSDKITIEVVPYSWQTIYQQSKKSPPNRTFLPSLGIMVGIKIMDYSPPVGGTINQQSFSKCKIPLHIPVDSLNNLLMSDFLIANDLKSIPVNGIEHRKQFDYQKSQVKNFDSIRWCCENYLLKRLGKSVYCNYVDIISSTCCSIETRPTKGFTLRYYLELPNLIKKGGLGWRETNYEIIEINFQLIINSDSTLQIFYPTNVPDCKGLPDCGFVITKDKAISILKKNGTLPDKLNYSIEADGLNWVVMFEDKEAIKTVKVDLQTGKQSDVQKAMRQ